MKLRRQKILLNNSCCFYSFKKTNKHRTQHIWKTKKNTSKICCSFRVHTVQQLAWRHSQAQQWSHTELFQLLDMSLACPGSHHGLLPINGFRSLSCRAKGRLSWHDLHWFVAVSGCIQYNSLLEGTLKRNSGHTLSFFSCWTCRSLVLDPITACSL